MEQRRFFALAAAFFLSLFGTTALAHPGAGAISLGSNPVVSATGEIDLDVTTFNAGVISAPADQDLVLTDIVLGMATENTGAKATGTVLLEDGTGTRLAGYSVRSGGYGDMWQVGVSKQFSGPTGVVVPAGSSVTIRWLHLDGDLAGYFNVIYTLSGYLAQP